MISIILWHKCLCKLSRRVSSWICSDEVQTSSASFIASPQLQTEANIHPTEVLLHHFSSCENPSFVQQRTGTTAVLNPSSFPPVLGKEISEINETTPSKNNARATKPRMAALVKWCKARNVNVKWSHTVQEFLTAS